MGLRYRVNKCIIQRAIAPEWALWDVVYFAPVKITIWGRK